DVDVAGGPARGADLALCGHLDAGAGVDAGRDVHREGPAAADAALAGAVGARLRDRGAEALAGRARLGGHDLAEERARDPLDHAATAAHLAGADAGTRAAAGSAARAARDGGLDLDLATRAERGLREVEVEA